MQDHSVIESAVPSIALSFSGGWFVYAGYELLHEIELTVLARDINHSIPLAALITTPAAILYHRDSHNTWLVAESAKQLQQLQQHIHPMWLLLSY